MSARVAINNRTNYHNLPKHTICQCIQAKIATEQKEKALTDISVRALKKKNQCSKSFEALIFGSANFVSAMKIMAPKAHNAMLISSSGVVGTYS